MTGTAGALPPIVVTPGVVLVTGPGGRGMTCSPAIAEETFLLSRFSVACLDMAGTTVRDDNTVMAAFAAAIASRNLPVASSTAR